MAKVNTKLNSQVLESIDSNLPFVSELLQSDVRLFIQAELFDDEAKKDEIRVHNYYHSNQDSLVIESASLSKRGEKMQVYKDLFVQKAFKTGQSIVGQFGLVINNRRIQEFAYPIILNEKVIAVVAVERDIYLTRNILGQHWDLMADALIKSLKEKLHSETRLPIVSPGEAALIIRNESIFFASPLAVNLLSDIAESSKQLIGRPIADLFNNYSRVHKGKNPSQSIESIQEVNLKQRTVSLRFVTLGAGLSVVLIKDISEIKIKETLLKEIHHRVKNNLQTVASLLRMQKRRNPELQESFDEAINRVSSMSLVHEFLSVSHDIETIDLGFLIGKVIKEIIASWGHQDLSIDFQCPEKLFVSSEHANNIALILNELLSNSLEHGGGDLSKISMQLKSLDDEFISLRIEDDGCGFPEDFDFRNTPSLGWEIITSLVEGSLSGQIKIFNAESGGAVAELLLSRKALNFE